MTTLREILTAAQALPSADRAQLTAALWNDVGPNDWVPPDDQWIAEAAGWLGSTNGSPQTMGD